MKYLENGGEIRVGDRVLVEDGAPGLVVCDFDRQEFLPTYEDWRRQDDADVAGIPIKGVLVDSEKYGLIHYEVEDETIRFVAS